LCAETQQNLVLGVFPNEILDNWSISRPRDPERHMNARSGVEAPFS